jgi:phage terminase large subunit-like protein
LIEKIQIIEELERRERENRLARYTPYPKQREFHSAGVNRERLFMAGNQLGKTWAGGYEAAFHATGKYPDWWAGKRFDRPTKAWVAGVTGESTRDNPQRVLLGEVGALGTGTIPKADIVGTSAARGINGLVDTVRIKHVSGGESLIAFKTYEKGREKWQGETLHWVWFDEEPPLDIYVEGLTRTNVTGGITFITFTPLLGMSDTVMRFIGEKTKSPGTHVTSMTIEDAEHYTPEQRAAIVASYPAHEREARAKGIPMLGSGRIFPIAQEALEEGDIEIPAHWPRICGLDFGWDHPFAAVWLAWDRDTDTVHVYEAYRASQESANVHAPAVRSKGDWIPVAWPHDGLQHDKGSGEQLAEIFRKAGVNMLPERATFPDGTNGVEAGVMDMLTRMETNRFKVNRRLTEWFEEFRMYHREDGKIVKERDDLLSATRYAIMSLRYAATKPTGTKLNYKRLGTV